MSAKRLYSPSILIDSVEYKCMAGSVALVPTSGPDWPTFCAPEWTFKAKVLLGYGTTESWTLLQALENTDVTVVLKPEDTDVGATNPAATVSIRMPPVAFMTETTRGDWMTHDLDVATDGPPVFDQTGS